MGDTLRTKGNELWTKFTSLPTAARIGILGGAGGLLFFSCICCGCIGIFSGKGGGGRSAAVANADAIKVSASELFQAYQANEVAADQKYKGKVLEVAGDVNSIDKDFLDHIYVTLKSGGQFEVFHVNCYFDDKYANEAANLSKGKHITVKGRCDGKAAGVNIRDCIFVEK